MRLLPDVELRIQSVTTARAAAGDGLRAWPQQGHVPDRCTCYAGGRSACIYMLKPQQFSSEHPMPAKCRLNQSGRVIVNCFAQNQLHADMSCHIYGIMICQWENKNSEHLFACENSIFVHRSCETKPPTADSEVQKQSWSVICRELIHMPQQSCLLIS